MATQNTTPSASDQLLSELRDIHIPDAPDWLPLAYGWWMVIGLAVVLLIVMIGVYYWHKSRIIEWPWHEWGSSEPENLGELANYWLKQAALLRFSRQDIARLHGATWIEFLQKNQIDCLPEIADWLSTGYLKNAPAPDGILDWLKQTLPKLAKRNII